MSTERTSRAYGHRAVEYIDLLGTVDALAEPDRAFVGAWADDLGSGRILDVGCGPGQWTQWLHERGLSVSGVDPTPEFVEHARSRYPDVDFTVGSGESLAVTDASLSGILAWYSLIHTPPEHVDVILTEFARCVEPGGGLLVGFFEGPESAPFDHAVATAYYWPVDALARRIERAGFTVTARETRVDPGHRPHGALAAVRGVPDSLTPVRGGTS
ncbi:class I SAM-dependent methyltransferase [Saccharomonospora sp. CUA-673]|uniref:class I SAM-dependent methyltransferase n=1 Tax=Saccharomonospora sp. CUA-673 TaxID=1904969 RepID=UPI001C9E2AB8|nr:class I SAM-dependent methyltransferase [Saccharomonospora sp. CUA-673]